MGEIIATIANVALALSVVVALIFGIAQVRAAERDRRERLTLDTLRNFQSREFAELINYIITIEMPKSQPELRSRPVNEQVAFIQLSQQMESLGILVAEGLINLDLVDKTLGSFVVTLWKRYETIFLTLRGEDPFIGEYFQWLAGQISERMKNNPRKPFYEESTAKIYR
jgi:hypothetical protein